MEHGTTVLFFELATSLTLLSLNTFALGLGEHLLVLDTQLATVDIHAVHGFNDYSSVFGRLEVGESETAEDAIVKVVIEGVGLRQVHLEHDGSEGLLADSERDILDDNSGRNKLIGVGAGGANIRGGGVGARVINAKTAVGELGAIEAAISLEIGRHGGHTRVVGPVLRVISNGFLGNMRIWFLLGGGHLYG